MLHRSLYDKPHFFGSIELAWIAVIVVFAFFSAGAELSLFTKEIELIVNSQAEMLRFFPNYNVDAGNNFFFTRC